MLVLSKLKDILYFTIIINMVLLRQMSVASDSIDMKKDALSKDINCHIEITDAKWTKIKAANVHIKLENTSKEKHSFELLSAFILEENGKKEEGMYLAPIYLSRNAVRLMNSKPDKLTLKGGESLIFDIDVSKIHWGSSISSLWPFQELISVVPPGRYRFYLDLGIIGANRIQSNEVLVNIE